MGFWHTGYMEFHEPSGLDGAFALGPTNYPCRHCEAVFGTPDELQKHRFEAHAYRRPLLFVRGIEVGTTPLRITSALRTEEVLASRCESARINGKPVSAAQLGRELAKATNARLAVELANEGVSASFDITFEIASGADLAGVEECFMAVARKRRLDRRAVEDFISAAGAFPSAAGYCDGICEYLYAVLAKERARDSSLPYDAYREKFNRAADSLKDFRRPLGDAIGALIDFHFNHFSESQEKGAGLRVGAAATRFGYWLKGDPKGARASLCQGYDDSLDKLLTDFETERLLSWTAAGLSALDSQIQDMESIVRQDIPEYDRAKLHIMLAETFFERGEAREAKRYARDLLNSATLGRWAENLLERADA